MKTRFILLFAAAFVLTIPSRAQTLVRKVNGSASELYGTAVIRAGDQNNDGFEDLLVGAPGHNGGNGAIYCVSGAFLALGSGTVHLWTLAHTTGSDSFGTSLARVGNVVGNAAPDFVVGAPRLGFHGGIMVVDGATHLVVATLTNGPGGSASGGQSVAAVGDIDGDNKQDVAVGAPGLFPPLLKAEVFVIPGSELTTDGTLQAKALKTFQGQEGFGTSVTGGFDLNGDGRSEVAVGSPLEDPGGLTDAGQVFVFVFVSPGSAIGLLYYGTTAGEHLGASIDAAHDYDSDGVIDLVVGAPDYQPIPGGTPNGRVVVLSGAKLGFNVPKEIFVLPGGFTSIGNMFFIGWHFGAAVRASPDLNNDGIGDIVVGMPGFTTVLGTPPGGARLFSGKTGARLVHVPGGATEVIGDAVLGAIGDLDGDSFPEWVVAGPNGDSPSTDCGSIKCYRLFPVTGSTYCTGKPNSLGCTPSVIMTGIASVSSASAFMVDCKNVVNKKSGVLIYSRTPGAVAFQGGFLCIKTPIKRLGPLSSGGSTTGNDCTGVFSFDFNQYIQSGADPAIVVGTQIFCQFWSRDPQVPSGTSLSNAGVFLVNP